MNINHVEPGDEELLSRILGRERGWRDELGSLLYRHHQQILSRCLLYLRNRQDAEDAVQETELRVFRAIHGFRGDSSFRTWLFAIADRQCHDIARKRTRHLLTDHLAELIEIHETSLRHTVDNTHDNRLIAELLECLPWREREILVLRFYLDLSLQEVASYLGIGLSAAKMRLYRALDQFGASFKSAQAA